MERFLTTEEIIAKKVGLLDDIIAATELFLHSLASSGTDLSPWRSEINHIKEIIKQRHDISAMILRYEAERAERNKQPHAR